MNILSHLNEIRKHPGVWLALILTLIAAVYLPALDNYLLRDDFEWLNESYDAWKNPSAFLKPINNFFRPLVKLSFLLNYTLFGTESLYYNLTTLLLHLVNIGLVWLLMRRITGRTAAAGVTALFYGISAHYSEVTLWSAARLDSLLLIFMLATLLHQHKKSVMGSVAFGNASAPAPPPAPEKKLRNMICLALLGLGALASKETGIILPLLAFAFEHLILRRNWKQALKETWPLFILLAAYMGYFLAAPLLSGGASPVKYAAFDGKAALWKAGNMFFTYAGLGDYFSGAAWQYLLLVLFLGALVFRLRRTGNRPALFGLLWLVICMSISLPIFHAPSRYNYLPLLGFWIMTVSFIDAELKRLRERFRWPEKAIMAGLVLFGFFYLTGQGVWLQWEIADYRLQAQPHRELVDMYRKVAPALPRHEAFLFVNAGQKRAVEEAVRNTRGHRKLLFMRADALWQVLYLRPLANFAGHPFRERLVTVPAAELPTLMEKNFTVLAFTDTGFFSAPSEVEALRAFYRREGKLPYRVEAVRFVPVK